MIDRDVVEAALRTALRRGGDFAEVFAEDRRTGSGRLDDGRVDDLTSGRDVGAGIRVVRGRSTGFAHTSDLTPGGLAAAARAAAALSGAGGGARAVSSTDHARTASVTAERPPASVGKAEKVAVLRAADAAARSESGDIVQVTASYADSQRRILVASSDGLLIGDEQVRTRFAVQCVARGDTGSFTGTEVRGRTVGFELFDEIDVERVARTAARRAVTLLGARPAPSGRLPVVLRRGAGGVLFHEACGHGLEADLVGRGASVFAGRVGDRVASPAVTLVDDGAFGTEWGSAAIDDEGTPTGRHVLIEDGVLTDYMWDRVRARREGRAAGGNGRRQSFRHLPLVRMTNTYLEAGPDDAADIIRRTPYGLYCAALGGGQVDTATGDFVFGVTEAYMIHDGEIGEPVRAAQLVGNGADVLRAVDAVGSDFDTWAGTCGKDGQAVPVSAGQPTLRVAEMTVGGTAGA